MDGHDNSCAELKVRVIQTGETGLFANWSLKSSAGSPAVNFLMLMCVPMPLVCVRENERLSIEV